MRLIHLLVPAALLAIGLPASAQGHGLDIYFVDTEGGQATLIVTPGHESILIDSGNPGTRDAGRIFQVATKVAGLKQIDNVVATHWHNDHYGGIGELAKLMPVKRFFDHGIPEKSIDDPTNFPTLIAAYKEASHGASTAIGPGKNISLKQGKGAAPVRITTLVGMQNTISERPGAVPNPFAAEFVEHPKDESDNANSLGFLLQFGNWRFLDLGDLTWNIEEKLVAPTDKIGKIDLYLTTHHGLEISNNPVLLKTVHPTVAIFNNGPRKGGHPDVTQALRGLSSVRAIWQLHRNMTCPPEMNTSKDKIANWDESCAGEFIKVSVASDGKSYTVQIGDHGTAQKYATK